jgi:predicted nucleic acid-binding protein
MGRTTEALVVDASVAVKWHLEGEDDNEQATLLLTRFSQGSILLVAPEQIRFEVPSAITAATLGKQPRLSQEEGKAAIDEFLALGLKTVGSDAVILAAYPLVQQCWGEQTVPRVPCPYSPPILWPAESPLLGLVS